MTELSKTDIMLLERLGRGDVTYRYEPARTKAKPKLVGSSLSPKQQAPLHALAVAGYASEHVESNAGCGHLPGTTVRFSLTALGRAAIGKHSLARLPVNRAQPLTEKELAAEGVR